MNFIFVNILFSIIGVSLDLYTTNVGLARGYVETRIFGNQPLISYPLFISLPLIIHYLGVKLEVNESINKLVILWFTFLSYIGFINNFLVLTNFGAR